MKLLLFFHNNSEFKHVTISVAEFRLTEGTSVGNFLRCNSFCSYSMHNINIRSVMENEIVFSMQSRIVSGRFGHAKALIGRESEKLIIRSQFESDNKEY